jgi:hypothetical protein
MDTTPRVISIGEETLAIFDCLQPEAREKNIEGKRKKERKKSLQTMPLKNSEEDVGVDFSV